MDYISMFGFKGKGFLVVLVGNSILVLVILVFLVLYRVCFLEEVIFLLLLVRLLINVLNMFSVILLVVMGDGCK